jgi:hypothetical protein
MQMLEVMSPGNKVYRNSIFFFEHMASMYFILLKIKIAITLDSLHRCGIKDTRALLTPLVTPPSVGFIRSW